MKLFVAVCLSLCLSVCYCAKLPPSFKKCHRKQPDFEKCGAEAVQHAIRQMNKPINELGVPNLEPLEIPSLSIGGGTGTVKLDQNYKNVKVYGITTVECSKFKVDFEKKVAEDECYHPEIRLEGDYNLDGKILLLDIKGKGKGAIILEKVKVQPRYQFEEYEKKGEKHYKVVKVDLKMIPERVRFDFNNLFNGDENLSKHVLDVINENWKQVYDDAKSSYEEAFAQIMQSIFNQVLNRVPVSELFGEE